ncbi:MAG: Rieske 2Fe-2S domain-containing protein, partial [Actinomycetota bacterium]|nr:Rieske 2Fe-2S domain-containing protein [Actinomycetota bacterium]
MTAVAPDRLVRAASLTELRAARRLVVHLERHTLCLFADGDEVYAVDSRCPHMGFPLHRGSVCDGILTCHWHHARFDLSTGGTFDQWADELRRFPVELDGDAVLVDLSPPDDVVAHQRKRLRDGLERDIPLVLAKATIALLEADPSGVDVFRAGLDFGVARRGGGWFRGLTTLTCFVNLAPRLDPGDRAVALYHGLADVAADSAMQPPRFALEPLPGRAPEGARLAMWFRQFIEVRDAEGAERAVVSAVRGGASPGELANMLFAAATDHRYLDGGHALDFVNKALEALDLAGWDRADAVLASLPAQLAGAERMEEANAWRNPVDLVALLERAFDELPRALSVGAGKRGWNGRAALVETILHGEAASVLDALLEALREGVGEVALASAVSFAAATRIARFPTSNEFGDWDTALHTFTFANAVEQGLRRSPSLELLRGVLDAAASVHLDRFLNVPATRLPAADPAAEPEALLEELPRLLDRQQQVDQAGKLVASFLGAGGSPARLLAAIGGALVR